MLLTNSLLEKQLSQDETTAIIAKLQQLGFFALQDAYEIDSNLLYEPNTDKGFNPGPQYFITVDDGAPKTIFFQQYREPYFIEPMKELLKYLNSFSSSNAVPYQPDRLLAAIVGEEGKRIPDDAIITPWPNDVTSPIHRSYMGILYLEGAEALSLYKAAGGNLYNYFSFEGMKYNVYLRPILPHECHIYHYFGVNLPAPAQPAFTCDDW